MIRKVILTNVAVFLFLIVIAELVFGNWIWGSDYGMLNIPRNVSRNFDTTGLYADGGRTQFSRDKNGLRGPYEDASMIDILAIGGSTTNQIYIDDNQTWLAGLRRGFKTSGHYITIVNAAVDGQSTRGHIKIFDEWFPNIRNLSADYILAYVGINDVAVHGAAQYDSMVATDFSRRIRNWVSNKSAIYNLFRTVRGIITAHDMDLVHGGGSPFDNSQWVRWQPSSIKVEKDSNLEKALISYRERLEGLVQRIRDFGAKPILVNQPTAEYRVRDNWIWVPLTKDGDLFTHGYRTISQFNDVTMDVCRKVGGRCIDLAREVEFDDGDFYDRIHNTPSGTKKIGQYLYDKLSNIK